MGALTNIQTPVPGVEANVVIGVREQARTEQINA